MATKRSAFISFQPGRPLGGELIWKCAAGRSAPSKHGLTCGGAGLRPVLGTERQLISR